MKKIFTYVAAALFAGAFAVSVANAGEGEAVNLMAGAIPADQCNQTPSAPWVAVDTINNVTGAGNGWQFRNSTGSMNGEGDAAMLFFRWNDNNSKWVYGYKLENLTENHSYKFSAKITTNDNKYNALVVGYAPDTTAFASSTSKFTTELYVGVNNWESMDAASVKTAEGYIVATQSGVGYVTFAQTNAAGNMIIRAWDFQLYDMGEFSEAQEIAAQKEAAQQLLDANARIEGSSVYAALKAAIENDNINLEGIVAAINAFNNQLPTAYMNMAIDAENDSAVSLTHLIVNPNPAAENDLTGWNVTGNSALRTMNNEGPETYYVLENYFDTNAWDKDWEFTCTQEVKLPAGVYRLAVLGRAATDALTTYSLVAEVAATDAAPAEAMRKIRTDESVDGNCNMIPYLTGNTGNLFGRGWGVYWCDFTVAKEDSVAVKIGVEGKGHWWASFGNFTLVKIEDVEIPNPANDYNALKATAQAAYDDPANAAALNGLEAAALKTLLEKTVDSDYEAAIDELQAALDAFEQAVPSYNKYAAEREIAQGYLAKVENEAAAETVAPLLSYAGEAWPKTAATAVVWADSLSISYAPAMASAAIGGAYTDAFEFTADIVNPEGNTLDGWNQSGLRINKNEGPTVLFTDMTEYFDTESNLWSSNSWNAEASQVVTLDAGTYRLSVLSRASADVEDYKLEGIVSEEADSTVNGTADLYHMGNSGNYLGNGWGISWCDFVVSAEGTPVTIKVSANTSVVHNWLSFGNFQLYRIKTSTGVQAVGADNAEARYYNLHGVEVANPTSGIYIKVVNGKATKIVK